MKNSNYPPFVIITPARNEEEVLGNTIAAMIRQECVPQQWVIVNDCSDDRTREIVEGYCRDHEFITIVNVHRDGDRDFGSKALAFRKGVEAIADVDYDYIGCLDADMIIEPDYYRRVLEVMESGERIGIGGGCVGVESGGNFVTNDLSPGSVGGALQLFRKQCYQDVGGYTPMKMGGIDALAELKAKANGWEVKKIVDLQAVQQRETGSAEVPVWKAKFREGIRFHSLGYSGELYLLRCLTRSGDRPVFVGSLMNYLGYLDSVIRRRPVLVDREISEYWKGEQRIRIRKSLGAVFRRGDPNAP